KMVIKLAIGDDKRKKKVMQVVAGFEGVVSVTADMKQNLITVVDETDPICLTCKLRRFGCTDLVSYGPVEKPKPTEPKPSQLVICHPHPTCCYIDGCPYDCLRDENPNFCTIL
ncbi:hypothetical protein KI387_010441, partial [Taxus chinensis]